MRNDGEFHAVVIWGCKMIFFILSLTIVIPFYQKSKQKPNKFINAIYGIYKFGCVHFFCQELLTYICHIWHVWQKVVISDIYCIYKKNDQDMKQRAIN